MHSLFMFLAYVGVAWIIGLFVNGWVRAASRKREAELNAMYGKIDTMIEKRVRAAIAEIKWNTNALHEKWNCEGADALRKTQDAFVCKRTSLHKDGICT